MSRRGRPLSADLSAALEAANLTPSGPNGDGGRPNSPPRPTEAWQKILLAVQAGATTCKKIARRTGYKEGTLRHYLPRMVDNGLLVRVPGAGYAAASRPM